MQPDISPLAKRLAEENNVKWQGLYGSGSEGRIVERDVLEYLARVMAGEEDLNPTAEPLPAGMDAWPEEDLAAANMTTTRTRAPAPQVTLTPVQSHDLGDDLLDMTFDDAPTSYGAAQAAASAASGQETGLADGGDVDDDMFLFDDAFEDDADSAGLNDAGLNDAGLNDAGSTDEAARTEMSGAEEDMMEFAFDTEEVETATEPAATFGTTDARGFDEDAFDVLADDLQALELETAPDTGTSNMNTTSTDAGPTTSAQDDLQDVALFGKTSDAPSDAESDSLFVTDEALFEAADTETAGTDDTGLEAAGLGETEFDDLEVAAVNAEAAETDAADAEDSESVTATAEDTVIEDTVIEDAVIEDTVTEDTAIEDPATEDVAFDSGVDASAASETGAEERNYTPAPSDANVAAPVVPYPAPQTAPGALATAGTSPQLVSYGVLLRRHVDLTKLIEAQTAIGQELGQGGPVAPSSLLLRAAAKTLLNTPLNDHKNVGLAVFAERGVHLAAVADVATRPFRDVVAAAARPETGSSTTDFGVVVADMSDFDIDEAVLNAGAPVLTLGRILYDNTQGSHHSTLALSGEVTVDQGTKFLAAVAELLDTPIRLVV